MIIKIQGSKAEIIGNYYRNKIDKALTFTSPGYWYSPAFKSGRWDGRIRFLKGNTFPVGFLGRVLKNLHNVKIECDYPDVDIQSLGEYIKKANLKDPKRDYQFNAIKEGCLHKLGIVELATNAGKGRVIAGMVAAFPQCNFLILAHRIDIIKEIRKELVKFVTTQNYELSTFQSANKLDLTQFDGVLVDEVQSVGANTFYKIVNGCINANIRLGFSATPKRSDGKDFYIEAAIGSPIIKVSQALLISRGISVKPKIYLIPFKVNVPSEFDYKDVGDFLINNNRRNKIMADLCIDRKEVMILFKNYDHGKLIHNIIPGSVYIDGSSKYKNKREGIKKDFIAGKIDVLVSSNIFDTGVNIPNIKTLILAWAGKSPYGLIQKIGRSIRICDGKDGVDIFMFGETGDKYFIKHTKIRVNELVDGGYDVESFKV